MGPIEAADIDMTLAIDWWKNFPNPLLMDIEATALQTPTISKYPRVITPHSAEAARLLDTTRIDVESSQKKSVNELSSFGVVVLKGPSTFIRHKELFVLCEPNSRLAVAGSGDILSGIIGGLMAQMLVHLMPQSMGYNFIQWPENACAIMRLRQT